MGRVPIILSMTTHAARNGTLGPTIESISNQTIKPDAWHVYTPPGVKDLDPKTVIRCDVDLGPVMKISAVAIDDSRADPDAIIITIDDDIVYAPNWLEKLLEACAKHPDEAIGFSGWNTTDLVDGGDYMWPSIGERCDVLEGWAGAAYRARFFDADVLKIPEPFKFVDDVWISSYLHRRGIGRRVIGSPFDVAKPTHATPGISSRPDFKQLNREAAATLFKVKGLP